MYSCTDVNRAQNPGAEAGRAPRRVIIPAVKMQDAVLEAFLQGIQKERPRIRAVYLFGSRARGDDRPDSDYDLLIVTDRKDSLLKDRVYDVATDVSLQTRQDLSLKFFSAEEFERLKAIPSRFIQQVITEGVKLG